jgi:hypothetical protein
MSDPNGAEKTPESEPGDDAPESELASWVRSAVGKEVSPPSDVLAGVQRKLRERSGGKFYADAWSTAKQPPILTFLVTSALMLVIVAVVYAVLAPLRGKPEVVPTEPAPIQVVIPAPH